MNYNADAYNMNKRGEASHKTSLCFRKGISQLSNVNSQNDRLCEQFKFQMINKEINKEVVVLTNTFGTRNYLK